MQNTEIFVNESMSIYVNQMLTNLCQSNVYVNSFFPHTARLWNSLPMKAFPGTMILMTLSLELTDIF